MIINELRAGVPKALSELIRLGRTLNRRAADVLAYFDRPRTSNGSTEAINGRLEHLCGTALGFRNLTNYIAHALLDIGGFSPNYTVICAEPPNASRWRRYVPSDGRAMQWLLAQGGVARPVAQRTHTLSSVRLAYSAATVELF